MLLGSRPQAALADIAPFAAAAAAKAAATLAASGGSVKVAASLGQGFQFRRNAQWPLQMSSVNDVYEKVPESGSYRVLWEKNTPVSPNAF